MTKTNGPAPGFVSHPNHSIRISKSDRKWTVLSGKTVLASSNRALELQEASYESVIYFPREDVSLDLMQPSSDRTTCPFKGEASYFSAPDAGTGSPIAWTYPAVYDEVSAIAGFIAFYTDRVELIAE